MKMTRHSAETADPTKIPIFEPIKQPFSPIAPMGMDRSGWFVVRTEVGQNGVCVRNFRFFRPFLGAKVAQMAYGVRRKDIAEFESTDLKT